MKEPENVKIAKLFDLTGNNDIIIVYYFKESGYDKEVFLTVIYKKRQNQNFCNQKYF